MINTETEKEAPSTCAACGAPISQSPGGHRRRRYCNDNCKQDAYRVRLEKKHEQEVRERWAGFTEPTQRYLEWLVEHNDNRHEFADGVAHVIRDELQRQAIEMTSLPDEPEDEHYQQRGQWLMECGKRLKYCPLPLQQYRKLLPGLFMEETDIYDIQGDRSHWESAAYSFSPAGQLAALVHIHQAEFLDRLLEQERSISSQQAFQSKVILEGAQRDVRDYSAKCINLGNQLAEVQQALKEMREKTFALEQELVDERKKYKTLLDDFMQAGKKIGRLERDLQRFERMGTLRSRESMLQELMVLGGRLKYGSLADPSIGEGIDHWLNYIRGASNEDLAKAIAHGYWQADALAMAAIEASDTKVATQMRQQIHDLRRDVALRDDRIIELEAGQVGQEAGDVIIRQQLEHQAQKIAELEREVEEERSKIHKLNESHGSTMFQMNILLAQAQMSQQPVSEQQMERDLNAIRTKTADDALIQTPYGRALLAVKDREDEVNHLKTRIAKQYERRIAKQQNRIEELEKALGARGNEGIQAEASTVEELRERKASKAS